MILEDFSWARLCYELAHIISFYFHGSNCQNFSVEPKSKYFKLLGHVIYDTTFQHKLK